MLRKALKCAIAAVILFSAPIFAWANTEPVKVLAIGNSFSEDAVENHLYEIAKAAGKPIIIGHMYIGGCTLERHVKCITENIPKYRYSIQGVDGNITYIKELLLETGLKDQSWDIKIGSVV